MQDFIASPDVRHARLTSHTSTFNDSLNLGVKPSIESSWKTIVDVSRKSLEPRSIVGDIVNLLLLAIDHYESKFASSQESGLFVLS